MAPGGGQFGDGAEDEGAQVEARVGKGERGECGCDREVEMFFAVINQVDVDEAVGIGAVRGAVGEWRDGILDVGQSFE